MIFRNGRVNTVVATGLAVNNAEGGIDLYQHGSTCTLVKASLSSGVRAAVYDWEPVIIIGSLAPGAHDGPPSIEVAYLTRASKSHIPAKLRWNRKGAPRDVAYTPIDFANKFVIRQDVLDALPERADFPDWFVEDCEREPGFAEFLDGAPHKTAFTIRALITGALRPGPFFPPEEGERFGAMGVWLKTSPDSPEIECSLQQALPAYPALRRTISSSRASAVPMTVLGRLALRGLTEERDGVSVNVDYHRQLVIEQVYAALQEDFEGAAA